MGISRTQNYCKGVSFYREALIQSEYADWRAVFRLTKPEKRRNTLCISSFLTLDSGEELNVLDAKVHKGFVIAKLEGVDDVNAAMRLKGKTLSVRREDAVLPKGAFFLQDIINARVMDEDGNEIGTLVDILETPASNVYVVKGETEHLIPAVPAFIKKTDPDAGMITVHLIEGM